MSCRTLFAHTIALVGAVIATSTLLAATDVPLSTMKVGQALALPEDIQPCWPPIRESQGKSACLPKPPMPSPPAAA